VLSGTGFCDGMIIHQEESYRVPCFSL
jgi:hypothetical protein